MSATPSERIAVIGLGYVGLPVALSMARKFDTVGFDVSKLRIDELLAGKDITGEVDEQDLKSSSIRFTTEIKDIKECSFFIVAVPTPIDVNRRPDLSPLEAASRTVGAALSKGDVVVYESTVYPGVTEEICGPILEEVSGMRCGDDFYLGYSPERINPGDKEHTFERITKVVSGQDAPTLERVAAVYRAVVEAGVHEAPSIKVAEAAKVIENTQRDLNIALMNELALIFDRIGIRTVDVLEAAATKWNFLRFTPGLVGGHCIGVDPYYLTTKAEELGYQPQVILSGRRINSGVGSYVAQKTLRMLSREGVPLRSARVGILGLTFKEDVPDLRNSRVPDIVTELGDFGVSALVHDPLADRDEAEREYGISLCPWEALHDSDAIILAVSHREYLERGPAQLEKLLRRGGCFVDVKSVFSPSDFTHEYWSL